MAATPELRADVDQGWVPANFDEWEAWIEGVAPNQPHGPIGQEAGRPLESSAPELVVSVDQIAGEYFRNTWRRRLADAEGDVGHVARQMRKSGVPLDLALAVLLMPEPGCAMAQTTLTHAPVAAGADGGGQLNLRYCESPGGRSLRVALGATSAPNRLGQKQHRNQPDQHNRQ